MAYQQMANLYDQLMKDAPYEQWVTLTGNIFQKSGKSIKHIADLGCGTGQIATRLAKSGYSLIGIDYSIDMLSYAQQRSSSENLPIQWIHQDLRQLEGITGLDAVVSFCDVINYMTTEEEVASVFTNVTKLLRPGGLFIFDVHSLYHVEHNFIHQTFAEVDKDVSYVWFCLEGEEPGEMFHDLTFFVAEGDKYVRFGEEHHQRTFSIDFYQKLLEESGFRILNLYGDFSLKNESLHEKTERIFFVAEKRPGK